jgi:hypothetical protein
VQIGVTALLVDIAAAIFRNSRPDIDPARPASSAHWHRQYLSMGAKALLDPGVDRFALDRLHATRQPTPPTTMLKSATLTSHGRVPRRPSPHQRI